MDSFMIKFLCVLLLSCSLSIVATASNEIKASTINRIISNDSSWRKNLGDAMYHVMKAVATIIPNDASSSTTTSLSLRRLLDIGDFEDINEILEGSVISIPDQTILNVNDQLKFDLINLTCSELSVGDIVINYSLLNNQRLNMTLDVIDLDVTCSFDYDYEYGTGPIISGNGKADAFTNNNFVKLVFDFESLDFATRPPSNFGLKGCNTTDEEEEDSSSLLSSEISINVVNIDSDGTLQPEIINDLVARSIEVNFENYGCSLLDDEVAPIGTQLIDTANQFIETYLEPLSEEYANPLYPEENLIVPPGVDLLNFAIVEEEIGSLVNIIVDAVSEFLDITNNTGIVDVDDGEEVGELKINEIIRDYLLKDRALTVDLSDFDFVGAPGDGVMYEGVDDFIYTKIILESIKIYGLDTFTTFEPLTKIGNYTLKSDIGLSYLDVEATFIFDIRPSSKYNSTEEEEDEENIIDEMERSIYERISIKSGVDDITATLSAFLAIDQYELESLTLKNLLSIETLAPCLLSTILVGEISGFNVTVGNIRQPVLTNTIAASSNVVDGVDRILTNIVDSLFIMYEAVTLKALPNIFQILLRDTINNDLIGSYLNEPNNTVCINDE